MKRYTAGIEQPHPELEPVAFMMEAKHGECVMHADHAAFVERVREIAEGMRHSPGCIFTNYKCTCVRGKLLEVCNG